MSFLSEFSDGLGVSFFDPDNLREGAMSLVGGALGGVSYGLVAGNVDWFSEGSENAVLLKKTALAVGLGAVAGAMLWDKGEDAKDVAKGLMGAMGAVAGTMVYNRFAGTNVSLGNDGILPQATASSRIALESTRVYQDELPANIGRVNVDVDPNQDLMRLAGSGAF